MSIPKTINKISSIVLLLVAFEYCSQPNMPTPISTKDSLLKNYLQITDSIKWLQNENDMRELLKAHSRNDTNQMRKMIQTITDYSSPQGKPMDNPNCPQPKEKTTYDFEDIYQFEYTLSFCNEKINITVAFNPDTAILSGYLYKTSLNSDSCLSYQKVDKILSTKEARKIGSMIFKSDIWGLKIDNSNFGFDGSNLTVTGCSKFKTFKINQYTRIYRWSTEQTYLGEAFGEILRTSNLKTTCINYPSEKVE